MTTSMYSTVFMYSSNPFGNSYLQLTGPCVFILFPVCSRIFIFLKMEIWDVLSKLTEKYLSILFRSCFAWVTYYVQVVFSNQLPVENTWYPEMTYLEGILCPTRLLHIMSTCVIATYLARVLHGPYHGCLLVGTGAMHDFGPAILHPGGH